jgi:CheY-like chemotaxis protein
MTDTPLAGRSVLVIEDDFYLADDARQTLEDAGAVVLGPVSTAEEALACLDLERPHCALVDVNLGAGADFRSARALTARNIPFVFLTGYDAQVIPQEFAQVPRLLKPTDLPKLQVALAKLTAQA